MDVFLCYILPSIFEIVEPDLDLSSLNHLWNKIFKQNNKVNLELFLNTIFKSNNDENQTLSSKDSHSI
jgi:hypothetical protein